MPQRTCTKCEQTLTQDGFARDAHKASGFKSICKPCDNLKSKAYYYGSAFRKCTWCSQPTEGQRHCSTACRDEHAWERRDPPLKVKDCARCGSAFATITGQRYCCPAPKVINREAVLLKNYKRRLARKHSDLTSAYVRALFSKAKRCPLCSVALTGKVYEPNSPELDHIIPINVGGTDTVGNVRVLCRKCNCARPHDGSDVTGQVTLWSADVDATPVKPEQQPREPTKRQLALDAARRANAAARQQREAQALEALRLRLTGLSWGDVAQAVGYHSGHRAHSAVTQRHTIPKVSGIRTPETKRKVETIKAMRDEGRKWDDVAEAIGYRNGRDARKLLRQAGGLTNRQPHTTP